MKYGCIGESLKHSFSKEIHSLLCDYEYELREIPKDSFDAFMKERDFLAINVTIPYKEAVIPYLYYTDEAAEKIGAVNTVINKDGKLYGYNTDFYGMKKLICRTGFDISGKKVLVLGSGGTSKTACAVCESLGASEIIRVSRNRRENFVNYEDAYTMHTDASVIINTTPVGMFPKNEGCPVDISRFSSLEAVFDAIYNPLRTTLIREAEKRKVLCAGGLYMLVAQAKGAAELFTNSKIPDEKCDEVFFKILSSKENIILVGMPGAGKTTIGRLVAEKLGRKFVDTDDLICEKMSLGIPEIFEKYGEEYFRNVESEIIAELSKRNSCVIATGGGAVMRQENADALSENGKLIFLDAKIQELCETDDRPLSNTKEKLTALYEARFPVYCERCDTRVEISRDAEKNSEKVISAFFGLVK